MRLYYYAWGNNEKRKTMNGRECQVLAYGKKSSVLIEFTDNGQREITDRRALRVIRTYKPIHSESKLPKQ
jgi:hypothetical protein